MQRVKLIKIKSDICVGPFERGNQIHSLEGQLITKDSNYCRDCQNFGSNGNITKIY